MAKLLIAVIVFALTNGVELPNAVEPSREEMGKITSSKWNYPRMR